MQPRLLRSTLVGLYVLAAICAARALPITVPEAPVQIDAAEAGGRHEADIIGSANGANRISAVPAGFTGGGDLSALGTSDPDAATAILKTGRGGIKEPNKAAAGTDQQPGNTALLASKGEQQTAAFGIRVYSAKEVETLGISNMPGASEYYLSARGPRDGTIFKVPLWLRPGFDRTVYIPLDGQAPDVASYVRFVSCR